MYTLPPFFSKAGRLLIFALLEVVCVILVTNNGVMQRYVIPKKVRQMQSGLWITKSNIGSYFALSSINDSLARENASLMQRARMLEQKISLMENISSFDSTFIQQHLQDNFKFRSAKVIRNSMSSLHNYIILDKGSKDGIKENMGVITPCGVVGIVRAVSENCSFVLSFLNSSQTFSAKIGQSGAFGPLKWSGGSILKAYLYEIPQHISFEQGDTVYTSGFSSFYPADIPVGTVEKWDVKDGSHKEVEVNLLQDFSRLDYALVVSNSRMEEIDSLLVKVPQVN